MDASAFQFMFLKSEATTICLCVVKHSSYHSGDLNQPAHEKSAYLKMSQWIFRENKGVVTNSEVGCGRVGGCRFKAGPFLHLKDKRV